MIKYTLLLWGGLLFGQAPTIILPGADSITTTSARLHWTSGFYHDTGSDITLTDGFTTVACGSYTLHVSSTANLYGWTGGIRTGTPTTFIVNGVEWGRVQTVYDATHFLAEMNCAGIVSDETETFLNTRSGLTMTVVSNVATVTTYYPLPSWWIAGHYFFIHYARTANLTGESYTIASVTDSTHFTFATSGVANGTYNYSTDSDIWMSSTGGAVHAPGETISLLNTDNLVCYGNPGGGAGTYPNSTTWRDDGLPGDGYPQAAQSSKHYAYIFGATAGSTVHYVVMSTPKQLGSSNCASPGVHTGVSSDATIAFPASEQTTPSPPVGANFSTALPAPYANSKVVGIDCPDLQTCVNTARSTTGNHELRIPVGVIITVPSTGIVMPPQTGGSLVTTIRSAAADVNLPIQGACLPPLVPGQPSPCIDNSAYTPYLATLQTGNSGTATPVFTVADYTNATGFHIGPGLKVQSNSHYSFNGDSSVALINLEHGLGGGQYGHAYHTQDFIVDRVYFYQKNIQNGARGAVGFQGGNSNAVVDCVVQGITNRTQDQGAINIYDTDTQDGGYQFRHNRIQGGSMPFFSGDAGWQTRDFALTQNWMSFSKAWHPQFFEYLSQVQLDVASAVNGATTVLTLADPSEFTLYTGFGSGFSVNFTGATGLWTGLNVHDFKIIDGTLTDFTCNGSICTTTTASAHGLVTGQYVQVEGLTGYPCSTEVGTGGGATVAHQITVTNATHFTYPSGTNNQCLWPQVSVSGPVFLPSMGSNTTTTIAFDSSVLGTMPAGITMRYGFAVDTKNLSELKQGVRVEISGNIFEFSIGQQQKATGFALTNRSLTWQDVSNFYAANGTISDINFHDNWFRDVALGIGLLGVNDQGSSIPMARVRYTNTLITDSSDIQCLTGQACVLTAIQANYGLHMVFDHLTSFNPGGVLASGLTSPPPAGDMTFTNSLLQFGGDGFNGGGDVTGATHIGAQIFTTSGSCTAGPCYQPNPQWPNSFTWGKNTLTGEYCLSGGCGGSDPWGFRKSYYYGYFSGTVPVYQQNFWPVSQAGNGLSGLVTITAASNTNPIVLTTPAMSCVPARGDRIQISGVLGNTAVNGIWFVRDASSTSIIVAASVGNAAYISGGTVIPLTGMCNLSGNWALGAGSVYRAGVAYHPADDPTLPPPVPSYPAGQGSALDGTDVGVNITALNTAIIGTNPCIDLAFAPTSASAVSGGSTGSFNATVTDNQCNRAVTSSDSWLTCTAHCTGLGSVTGIGWAASSNSGIARSATLSSNGVFFTVNQDAAPPPPTDQIQTTIKGNVKFSGTAVVR